MSRAAQHTANYEARMKAKGFVRKHVWVPADKAGEVEAFAKSLRRASTWDEKAAERARLEILTRLSENRELLREALDIRHITLFGSYARGDATAESDVDLYVEREAYAKTGLLSAVKIQNVLSDLLGCEVDVVLDKIKNADLIEAIDREGIEVF